MKHLYRIALISGLLLTGCQQGPDEHNAPQIAESQRQSLEQAKALSGTLQQSAEEKRRQIDAAGE